MTIIDVFQYDNLDAKKKKEINYTTLIIELFTVKKDQSAFCK